MSNDGSRDAPPTSRLGRLLRLGSLAPSALPMALAQARRAMGSEPTEDELLEQRRRSAEEARKVAAAMLKTLGEMKGLPLKIGQMLSYIDGLAPPGYEEQFQEALRKLQQKAPPLDPEAAERVIRAELKAPPEELFARWEREPFAAASIGQVHRAVTRSGHAVAVKVQYPGIDRAIENDLKSMAMLEQFAAPFARPYHSKEALDELRSVFLDELDYSREARMADLFRAMTADIPGIVIPRVHHGLSTRRVLTTELLGGQSYHEFCAQAPQDERDAAGVALWSFMFSCLLRHGMLYADPHPGNYRFLGGGRVGVLDFGCVKQLPPELVAGIKTYIAAGMDADWKAFDRACIEVFGYDPSDKEAWDLYRSYSIELLMPFTSRAPFQWSPEVARETVGYLARGLKKIIFKEGESLPNIPKPIHMKQDFTFVNRLQWGLASILGGLRVSACFRDIGEPWVRGDLLPLPGSLSGLRACCCIPPPRPPAGARRVCTGRGIHQRSRQRPLPIPCGDGTRGAGTCREVPCSGGDGWGVGEGGTSRRWGLSGRGDLPHPPAPSPVRRGGAAEGATHWNSLSFPLLLPLSVQERGPGGEANRAPRFPTPRLPAVTSLGPGPPAPAPLAAGAQPHRSPSCFPP